MVERMAVNHLIRVQFSEFPPKFDIKLYNNEILMISSKYYVNIHKMGGGFLKNFFKTLSYEVTNENYNSYKKEIKDHDVDTLDFMRIELQSKIYPVDSNIVYISLFLGFASFLFNSTVIKTIFDSLSNGDNTILCKASFVALSILVALFYNFYKSKKNKDCEIKIEIIKLRIEELKQEELNKKREIELNKVLNHENDTLIKKIIKFLRIN